MFLNSTLIDFGCGMGQNTLVYDHLGASCTLLEYDNFSFENAKSLFSNHAKNRFNIINTDKFDFKVNEKFDFVISNGVAHHTHNPIKCLNICCDALKQGGFFILGIANKAGSFQRNLQRLILYSISNDNNDIIKYSKLLFKEHIRRSVRFSGRYANEIIYDAYINPKIYTFGTQDIMDIFFNNNITFYSSYDDLKDIRRFLEPNTNQFKLTNTSKSNSNNGDKIYLSSFEDISLTNNNLNNTKLYKQFNFILPYLNSITQKINDLNFGNFDIDKNLFLKDIASYRKKLLQLNKIDIINKKHNDIFFKEVYEVINVLNKKNNKNDKFIKIKKRIDKSENLFKFVNGVGINYYCGYKNE